MPDTTEYALISPVSTPQRITALLEQRIMVLMLLLTGICLLPNVSYSENPSRFQ